MSKIEITNYINAQQFLTDYYHKRKNENPTFSYGTWAEELGLKNRSLLRMMVIGR